MNKHELMAQIGPDGGLRKVWCNITYILTNNELKLQINNETDSNNILDPYEITRMAFLRLWIQSAGGVSPTEMAKLALPSNSRPMETSNENSCALTINIYFGHFMNSLNAFSLAEYVL